MRESPLDWLERIGRRPIRPGPYSLELVTELLERLGRPQDSFLALHVAGTRGKGSTCALLAAALEEAGHAAGLTTSPHLVAVTERVRLRERDSTREELAGWLERVREAAGELEPSYFEALIATAFTAFADEGLPLAVVEVGLGGRLDATVLCNPAACAITRLGLEHRDRLGDTLAEIAGEKAGILKAGVPAVLAPNEPEAVSAVRSRAEAVGAPLRLLGETELAAAPDPGLPGAVQRENSAVAWALLEELARVEPRWAVSREQAEAGFAKVRWPGRLDRRSLDGVELLLDCAHDSASLAALIAHADATGFTPAALVFTCLGDKDLAALAGRLADAPAFAAAPVLVPELPGHPRARPAESVAAHLRAAGLDARAVAGVDAALDEAVGSGGPVAAFGSLVLAGAVLERVPSGS